VREAEQFCSDRLFRVTHTTAVIDRPETPTALRAVQTDTPAWPSNGTSNWRWLMSKALRESDPTELANLVCRVEDAVLARRTEMNTNREIHRREAEEMSACLCDLLWIKTHRLGWPDIREAALTNRLCWSPGTKIHWKEVFSASLHEATRQVLRPDMLKARLLVAEIAIMNRGLELGATSLDSTERSELLAAAKRITEISEQRLGHASL
jgi:hypothetical protein